MEDSNRYTRYTEFQNNISHVYCVCCNVDYLHIKMFWICKKINSLKTLQLSECSKPGVAKVMFRSFVSGPMFILGGLCQEGGLYWQRPPSPDRAPPPLPYGGRVGSTHPTGIFSSSLCSSYCQKGWWHFN